MKNIIVFSIFVFSFSAFAEKIKIGASASLSTAGFYLAQEKGYFKNAGLDTEIIVLNNSTAQMTTLLAKNELQVGAGNLIAGIFNAYSAGEKFKIVADKGHISKDHQYIWLIVRKDLIDSKKVKTIKDLKGLKIGLPSTEGSSQQIVLDQMLQSEKLSLKDVELVKIGYPDMNVALKQKNIDAAIQLEPFLAGATENEIAVKFKSAQSYRPDQQSAAVIFSEKFSSSKDAQKFMNAYLLGVADYNSALKNKEEWLAIAPLINKYSKLDGEKSWKKIEAVGLNNDGSMNMDSIKADLDWYEKNGFLKSKIEIKDIVDSKFVQPIKK